MLKACHLRMYVMHNVLIPVGVVVFVLMDVAYLGGAVARGWIELLKG